MANWIELAEMRDFLQFGPDTSQDDVLQAQIDAACASIERIKGRIGVDTVAGELQDVQPRGNLVILDESPVVSVQSVSLVVAGASPTPVASVDPSTGSLVGYELLSPGGVLTVPAPFGARVLVDYTVGLTTVPADWHEAAVELSAYLYESSQNNASGGRSGSGTDDQDWPNRGSSGIGAYAMPFRVRELLGLYDKVVRSGVWVR